MAVPKTSINNVCPLGEIGDEASEFQRDSESVAKEFLKLSLKTYVSKGTSLDDDDEEVAYVYIPEKSTEKPAAVCVAERLSMIGDSIQIDSEVNAAMVRLLVSVFDIDLPVFTEICRSVLIRCYSRMTNGWQQVYTVYYSMARVVQELRQQPNLQTPSRRQREAHLQQFVGPVMQDLGLEAWIVANGGLVRTLGAKHY